MTRIEKAMAIDRIIELTQGIALMEEALGNTQSSQGETYWTSEIQLAQDERSKLVSQLTYDGEDNGAN